MNDNVTLASGDVMSLLSKSYDSIKGTGLYAENVRYDKRFPGEYRDSIVT